MDTMSAMIMGEMNRGNPKKVFDWVKAAELIKKRKPHRVSAGLVEDWSCTGGEICVGGVIVPEEDTYVYLASTWATPVIEMDGETVDCFIMEDDTTWDSGTYWPKEALAVLGLDSELSIEDKT